MSADFLNALTAGTRRVAEPDPSQSDGWRVDPEARSGILALHAPPGVDAASLVAPLATHGVVVTAPDGCLRVAPSWPKGLDEVPHVLDAVDDVLAGPIATSSPPQ